LLKLQNFAVSVSFTPKNLARQKSLETFPVMMVLCRSLFHVPIIREDIFLAGGGISRIYFLPAFPFSLPLPSPSSPSPYPPPPPPTLLPHRKKIATGNAIRENSRQGWVEKGYYRKERNEEETKKATK
jgi:hypothetical protein